MSSPSKRSAFYGSLQTREDVQRLNVELDDLWRKKADDSQCAHLADAETVTGLWTFDRGSAAPPFAVDDAYAAGATVTNLSADLLDGQHAAAFAPVAAGVPTGAILPYGGTAAPTGYLLCDGSLVSRATYAALFAVLGTAYGAGDGSTTFGLPDLRARVAAGYKAADADCGTLGGTGGAADVTLDATMIPAHSHGVTDGGHSHGLTNATSVVQAGNVMAQTAPGASWKTATPSVDSATTGIALANTGGGLSHENWPPFAVVNWIIKT